MESKQEQAIVRLSEVCVLERGRAASKHTRDTQEIQERATLRLSEVLFSSNEREQYCSLSRRQLNRDEMLEQRAVWDMPERTSMRKLYSEIARERYKGKLREGEVACVLISHKGAGKPTSYVYSDMTVDWSAGSTLRCLYVVIKSVPYIAVHDVRYTAASTVNRTASKLLGEQVKGPVIVIHLDHEHTMTHMTTEMFKSQCLSTLK